MTTLKASFSRQLRTILVSFVVFVTLPLLILSSIVFTVAHHVVLIVARIFRPELRKTVTGIQGAMSLEDIYIRPKINILVYYVVEGTVTKAQFSSCFHKRILSCTKDNGQLMYPELRQLKTTFLNYFFLKDDPQFDLKNHIRNYDYNGPLALPEANCDKSDLERVMGGLLAEPWKKGQSPWEILIVNNYKEDGDDKVRTAIVVRLHHSLADGYSILKITLRLMEKMKSAVPQPNFAKMSMMGRCAQLFNLPFKVIYYMAISMIDGYDPKHAWHLTDGKLSRQYNSCVVERIPVNMVKEIRKRYEVNYNAVLAAVACGAIRRVMKDAGQEVPKSMAVFMPLPLPDHPDGLVIHASGMYVPWPMELDSPTERLMTINGSMNRSNMGGQLLASKMVVALFKYFPIFVSRMIHDKLQCTLSFSSFPASTECLEADGVKLTDAMFAFGLPSGKLGATVTLLSLGEGQRIVLSVDKTVYGDEEKLQRFSGYVHEELQNLLQVEVEPA